MNLKAHQHEFLIGTATPDNSSLECRNAIGRSAFPLRDRKKYPILSSLSATEYADESKLSVQDGKDGRRRKQFLIKRAKRLQQMIDDNLAELQEEVLLKQTCKIIDNKTVIERAKWLLENTIYSLIPRELQLAFNRLFEVSKNELKLRTLLSDWNAEDMKEKYELMINFLDGVEMIYGIRSDVKWEDAMIEDAREWTASKEDTLLAQIEEPRILDVLFIDYENISNCLTLEEINHPDLYYASGSAAKAEVFLDGKKLRMNKTQWMSSIGREEFLKRLDAEINEIELVGQLKIGEANKIRLFVSSDLESYLEFCIIYEYICRRYKGCPYIWVLCQNQTMRKMSFMKAVELMSKYNWSAFPGDQSKFDHRIPLKTIVFILSWFKNRINLSEPSGQRILKAFNTCIHLIRHTKLRIQDLILIVLGGLMSGQKITNILGGTLNLYINILVILANFLAIWDLTGQGDDIENKIDKIDDEDYKNLVKDYLDIGVHMHEKKNFYSNDISFFLRQIIGKKYTLGMAVRPLNSFYFKAQSGIDEGMDSLMNAWNLIASRLAVWREWDKDKYEAMLHYSIENSFFKNIKSHGMGFIKNPQNYRMRYVVPHKEKERTEELKRYVLTKAEKPFLYEYIVSLGQNMSLEDYTEKFIAQENKVGLISRLSTKQDKLTIQRKKCDEIRTWNDENMKTWFNGDWPVISYTRTKITRKPLGTKYFGLNSIILQKQIPASDKYMQIQEFNVKDAEARGKIGKWYSYPTPKNNSQLRALMHEGKFYQNRSSFDNQLTKMANTEWELCLLLQQFNEMLTGVGKRTKLEVGLARLDIFCSNLIYILQAGRLSPFSVLTS